MLVLDTIEHETIWGGRRLSRDKSRNKKIGHLYSLITEAGTASKILNGPHAGEPFRDYFQSHKDELGLGGYSEFPFVVALVEAQENLSIQVHPDDETAWALERQKHGKNESWFFLEAPADGWIYNGCACESKAALSQKLKSHDMEGITDKLAVKRDDYVYVEAGTLHSLTRGALVYEIEENSNLTYRFYDFDRRDQWGNLRELHMDKACQALDVDKKSSATNYSGANPISQKRYSTQLIKDACSYENISQSVVCLTLLEGDIEADGIIIAPGTSVLLLPGERIEWKIKTAMVAYPV